MPKLKYENSKDYESNEKSAPPIVRACVLVEGMSPHTGNGGYTAASEKWSLI